MSTEALQNLKFLGVTSRQLILGIAAGLLP